MGRQPFQPISKPLNHSSSQRNVRLEKKYWKIFDTSHLMLTSVAYAKWTLLIISRKLRLSSRSLIERAYFYLLARGNRNLNKNQNHFKTLNIKQKQWSITERYDRSQILIKITRRFINCISNKRNIKLGNDHQKLRYPMLKKPKPYHAGLSKLFISDGKSSGIAAGWLGIVLYWKNIRPI